MAKLKKSDEIKQMINELNKNNYEQVTFPNGIFYILDKNEYSFRVMFVYNNTKSPTVDEIYYNLKDREYYLYRNNKELCFSEENLVRSFGRCDAEELSFLEVPENEGFYQKCFDKISAIGQEYEKMVSRFLIRLIEDFPVLERIHKAGFDINKVFNDIENFRATSLVEAFKFETKYHLKMYKKLKSNPDTEFCTMAYYIGKMSIKNLQFLEEVEKFCKTLDEKYGLNKWGDIYDNFIPSRYSNGFWYERVEEIQKSLSGNKKGFEPKRLIEYCGYECDVKQGIENFRGALNIYVDYVRMASALGTKFERYPKSLKLRHDVATKFHYILDSKDTKAKFVKNIQNVVPLEGKIKNTNWAIVAPKLPEDLVDEGEQLSHCVKSYIQSIANENCNILFLRKADDLETSVYTVELRDNIIVQFAGYSNCAPDEDAKEALHIWAQGFNLIENYE